MGWEDDPVVGSWQDDPVVGRWQDDPVVAVAEPPAQLPAGTLTGFSFPEELPSLSAEQIAGPPGNAVSRAVVNAATGIGTTLASAGARIARGMAENAPTAREFTGRNDDTQFLEDFAQRIELEQAERERVAMENAPGGIVGRALTGAAATIPKAIASGLAGGPAGVIGTFVYDSASRAYAETGDKSYALTQGVIEGTVTAAFQAFGMGGLEKGVLRGASWQGVKQLAKQTAAEVGEEELIGLSQAISSQLEGVDPQALKKFPGQAAEIAAQTLVTMGAVGGSQKARAFLANPNHQNARRLGIGTIFRGKAAREELAAKVRATLAERGLVEPTAPTEPVDAAPVEVAQEPVVVEPVQPDVAGATEAAVEPAPVAAPEMRPESTRESPLAPDAESPLPTEPPPVEPPPTDAPVEVADDSTLTAAKRAFVDRDRELIGLDEIPDATSRPWAEALLTAKSEGLKDRAVDMATAVLATPRALNDVETAGLVLRMAELKNAHADAVKRNEGVTEPAQLAVGQAELNRIETELETLTRAARTSGTEKGRALAAQKLTIDQNYDLASVVTRAKLAKGAEVTPAERSKLAGLAGKHKRNEQRAKALDAKEKKQKHREVQRIGSAIKAIRQKLGLDKISEANAAVPGLSDANKAELVELGKKLKEAEAALDRNLKEPDRVHNRPSEVEVSKLDDAISRVRKILQGKTAPNSAEVERKRIEALQKQLAEIDRRIAERDVSAPPKKMMADVASQERDALQADVRTARDALAEIRKTVGLSKQLAEAETALKKFSETGVRPDVSRRADVASEERTKVHAILQTVRRELRLATKDSGAAEKKKVEALQKKLVEMQERIRTRNVTPTPRTGTADVMGAERAKVLQEIRTAQDSINEIRRTEQVGKRLAEAQEALKKVHAGTYTPTSKRRADVMSEQRTKLDYELQKTRQELRHAINAMKPGTIWDRAKAATDMSLGLMTSIDYSAVLRQGKFVLWSHPKLAAKALPSMFKAGWSPRLAHKIEQQLKARDNARNYELGLHIDWSDTPLGRREENLASKALEKVPIVAGSQRAYRAYLNVLRADAFDLHVKTLGGEAGLTKQELADLGHAVNVFTGRGDWKAADAHMASAGLVLFSPRKLLGNLQFVIGEPAWRTKGKVRRLVQKEYLRNALGATLWYSLYAMAFGDDDDYSVTFDPRSSDFGKIKLGDVRIDPLSGLAQIIRLAGQTGPGGGRVEGKSVKKMSAYDRRQAILRFAQGKANPFVSHVLNLWTGEDIMGDPYDFKSWEGAYNATLGPLTPIGLGDFSASAMREPIKELGVPRGLAADVLSIFGEGVQVYEKK